MQAYTFDTYLTFLRYTSIIKDSSDYNIQVSAAFPLATDLLR